jgi:uncharacterized protein (DUF1015 family)
MPAPEIRPFRAVRFDEGTTGDLGLLLAPPYDVSTPELITRLHERSPLNMTHLEHVRPDPGANPHAMVAKRYRQWLAQGILRVDESAALYRYDHTFTVHGQTRTRRGIFAAVRLAPWEERVILPHERTFPGPVAERLGRLRAVRANLSPVYLLADDPSGGFGRLLAASEGRVIASAVDPDGERHELARLDDPGAIAAAQAAISAARLCVADGHHRYEAALAYRDEARAAGSGEGSDFVLALIADASDPSVIILPTHRLVRGPDAIDHAGMLTELGRLFVVEWLAEPAIDGAIGLIGFAGEKGWWRLAARDDRLHASYLPADRSPAWHGLPAGIVEAVVVQGILGIPPRELHARVSFTQDAETAARALRDGVARIAILLPPPAVADVIAIAAAGDRMPAKSTYFQPKVPAGLVIYDFALS